MFIKKAAWITILALALSPAAALADSLIDFSVGPFGTISYAGGAAPMVGSAIPVHNVTGTFGVPLHDGVTLPVDFGSLDYSTGPYDPGTSTSGSVWNFGPGGSIVIKGCIPGVTSPTCTSAADDVILLTGSFVLPEATAGSAGMSGSIADYKNFFLLAYYGVTPQVFAGSMNHDFNDFRIGAANSFSASAGAHGGVDNNVPSTVPEPASLALMGTGLVGLAGIVRRKLFS